MKRKPLPKVTVTPELKEHYSKVGIFLKSHPEIKWRKLVLGFEVDVSTIKDELISEWLTVTEFDYKTIDKN